MRLVTRLCLVLFMVFCSLAVGGVGASYAADAQQNGTISGRVYDDQGIPLADADVWADYWDGGGANGTRTDADGNYTIQGLADGQYRVGARANGQVQKFYPNTLQHHGAIPVVVTAGQTTGNINFTLEPGGTISGVVYDNQGQPLAGISIDSWRIDGPGGMGATTRADGTYTLEGLPFGTYKISAPGRGRWGANDGNWAREFYNEQTQDSQADLLTVSGSSPSVAGINFTLNQGDSISGKVYDDHGNPLVNADVWADYWDGGRAGGTRTDVRTDVNGDYIIQGLANGQYRVAARAPGRVQKFYQNTLEWDQATPVIVNTGQDTADINIALEPGATISGVVYDDQGHPLSYISVGGHRIDGPGGAGATTRADGTYTLKGLPFGKYEIVAPESDRWGSNDGNWAQSYNDLVAVSVSSPNATGINLSLVQGGSITGRVYDDLGSPLANADVWADYWDGGRAGETRTRTDENGNYTIKGLAEGQYRVTAQAPGRVQKRYLNTFIRSEMTPVVVTTGHNTADINFALEPGGTISGVVYDDKGHPLADISVSAWWWHGPDSSIDTITGTDGSFTLEGLPFKEYEILAPSAVRFGANDGNWAQKFYNDRVAVSENSPNATGINLTLEIGGTISGVVYDNLGHPLADISVSVRRVDGPGASGTTSRADGSYTLEGLSFGQYKVSAPSGGRWGDNDGNWAQEFYNEQTQDNQADIVTVAENNLNVSGVNFTLVQGGRISGTVYDNQDHPLADADVWAEYWDGGWAGGTRTDDNGNYTLQGLANGQYRVAARLAGRVQKFYQNTLDWDLATPVDVTAGQNTANINFALEPGGTISGVVYDDQGHPLAYISVEGHQFDGPGGGGATTRADGTYTLEGLPFGEYILSAPGWGRREANDGNWAREFYNESNQENQADLVTVSQISQNVIGVNFTLTQGGSISGRVYDNQGNPLANADVWADYWDGGGGTRTDENGNYTLQGLADGQYRVMAKAPGRVQKFYLNTLQHDEATLVVVTAGQDTADINFDLEPGGTISGVVYDDQGNPLADISVQGSQIEGRPGGSGTTTREDGTYTLEGLPFGEYKISAPGGGRWGADDSNWVMEFYNEETQYDQADLVTVAENNLNVSGVNFTLTQGGSITGRVYDNQGNPLANADVWADNWDGGWAGGTRTDVNGNYTIQGLADGQYRVMARAPGRVQNFYLNTLQYDQAIPVAVTTGQNTANINFALEPGGTISGVVYDNLGNPLAYISVEGHRIDGPGGGGATTGADGSFTLEGLPFGQYSISAPGSDRWEENDGDWAREHYYDLVAVSENSPSVTGINLSLVQGGSITGTVYDEMGHPLVNADVWADDYWGRGWAGGTRTDENGNYTIRGLADGGQYRVAARAPGRVQKFYQNTLDWDQATPVIVTTGQDTASINFALDPGGTISGVVYDNQGHPLADISVGGHRIDGPGGAGATTREDGTYTLEGLPFGEYEIVAPESDRWGANDGNWAQSYNDLVIVSVNSPNMAGINLSLVRGGRITGRVYDELGNPLANADVWAEYWDGWAGGTRTDDNGNYILQGLADGQYRVTAKAPGRVQKRYLNTFMWDQMTPVVVTSGQDTANINFALEPGGTISGVVYDDQGHPLADISVDAWWHGPDSSIGATTGTDGSFTLEGLPFGEYEILAPGMGRGEANDGNWVRKFYGEEDRYSEPYLINITAANPNVAGYNFTLNQGGSITGRVYDDRGNPLANADVWADYWDGGWAGETRTDENGNYTLEGLTAGQYRVAARAPGRVQKFYSNTTDYSEATPVTVETGQNTFNIYFALESGVIPNGGTIKGKVTLPGRNNYSGVTVTIEGTNFTTVTDNQGNYQFDNVPAGNYKIRVRLPKYLSVISSNIAVLNGQVSIADLRAIPGDVKADVGNIIDIYDLTVVATAFNGKPGSLNWNASADINNDNIIDIYDLVLVATNFGQKGQ